MVKEKYTPETITVYPVNRTKLDAYISANIPHADNKTLDTAKDFALVKEPKMAIIDTEFVGESLSESGVFYFPVWVTTHETDGRTSWNMYPSYNVRLTPEQLEEFLDSPVSLAEFTKERRGYNPRIQDNEHDWIRWFNGKEE